MDRDNSAVYFNVVSLLSPETRRALNVVSQHTGANSGRVQQDNVFWKHRFELLVGQEYPATKRPGVTTWQHKVKTVEQRGLKGLLLSDELLDVEAAIRVVSTDSLTPKQKQEIVGHALLSGNINIITLLASIPGLEFKKYAAKAVYVGVEVPESPEDNVYSYYDDIPPAVLQVILQPMFGLNIDVPRAVISNILHTSLATLAVLLNDPQALLTQNGQDYLVTAWDEDRIDMFFYLLDHTDVTLSRGVFEDLYDSNDKEMIAEFRKHPKTAVFLQ